MFSRNLNLEEQGILADVMQVNLVHNMGNYLRLPTDWGASKSSLYGLLKEKMESETFRIAILVKQA